MNKSAVVENLGIMAATDPDFSVWLPNALERHIKIQFGKSISEATAENLYYALGLCLREQLIDRAMTNEKERRRQRDKTVHYLSLEFLVGPLLENNLLGLGMRDAAANALRGMGFSIDEVLGAEPDPALGNGGLGRLAACFLDSMATLDIAGYGYGINYEFGLFNQSFSNGWQKECPDRWKIEATPWQVERVDEQIRVPVYGHIVETVDEQGQYSPSWLDWKLIIGVPQDMPIVGFGGKTVNYLRLYSARASDDFDMRIFNQGDYVAAVEEKIRSENITKVLYPDDTMEQGQELRLIQEYFLVACSVRNIIDRHLAFDADIRSLAETTAIQLNDTHPALAIIELLRVLIDEHQLAWEQAWTVVTNTFAFTNHTLLPEALESWPAHLMERVIPRHLQLIREVNRRFLEELAGPPPEIDLQAISVFTFRHDGTEMVQMGHLSIIGSHSVNGVAALHSELIKTRLVPNFYEIWPEKFNNKTNGITQRRWLLQANPNLADLVTDCIGDGWITDLLELRKLEQHIDQSGFLDALGAAKDKNKQQLAHVIKDLNRISVDPKSLFDVQIKRIHEYKRQLLNAMKIIHLYFSIIEDGIDSPVPQTFIFGGKAAPGYIMAKRIIKLINSVAKVVNADPRVNDQIKVVFLPNYRVSLAEKIIAAADVSEQISTAGFEASGTGNMKLALNGAVTIGTLDGANIEIAEEVGSDNIYIFGLTANDVINLKESGNYNTWAIYDSNPRLKRVIDSMKSGLFCEGESEIFDPIVHSLQSGGDYFMLLADFDAYIDTYDHLVKDYGNRESWQRKSLYNTARIGKFSSDRTIKEYARDIWKVRA